MKNNKFNVWYTLSGVLVIGFVIKNIVDYAQYNDTLHSAPFYIWIFMNAVYFIIPSIVNLNLLFIFITKKLVWINERKMSNILFFTNCIRKIRY